MKSTLVLGVGNPLCGDDGLGPRVVELLSACPLPPGVQLEAAGTPGWGLPNWLEGYARAILVDAARMGQAPGAWRRFGLDEVRLTAGQRPLSLHESELAGGLALAEAVGALPDEVVIYGVEPASCDWGQTLSPAVSQALPGLVQDILAELQKAKA